MKSLDSMIGWVYCGGVGWWQPLPVPCRTHTHSIKEINFKGVYHV